VNASNGSLHLGAGVSGALRKKARPSLQVELNTIAARGPIPPGGVILTGSHGLSNCLAIAHANTVGGNPECVGSAVSNALQTAARNNYGSILFPALGTGTGGMSLHECATVMLTRTSAFFLSYPNTTSPTSISFVLYTEYGFKAFLEVAEKVLRA
jgi:O-acetyl-ADP-ribose deacetylase